MKNFKFIIAFTIVFISLTCSNNKFILAAEETEHAIFKVIDHKGNPVKNVKLYSGGLNHDIFEHFLLGISNKEGIIQYNGKPYSIPTDCSNTSHKQLYRKELYKVGYDETDKEVTQSIYKKHNIFAKENEQKVIYIETFFIDSIPKTEEIILQLSNEKEFSLGRDRTALGSEGLFLAKDKYTLDLILVSKDGGFIDNAKVEIEGIEAKDYRNADVKYSVYNYYINFLKQNTTKNLLGTTNKDGLIKYKYSFPISFDGNYLLKITRKDGQVSYHSITIKPETDSITITI